MKIKNQKCAGDDGKSERRGLYPSLSPSPPLSDAKRPLPEKKGTRNYKYMF